MMRRVLFVFLAGVVALSCSDGLVVDPAGGVSVTLETLAWPDTAVAGDTASFTVRAVDSEGREVADADLVLVLTSEDSAIVRVPARAEGGAVRVEALRPGTTTLSARLERHPFTPTEVEGEVTVALAGLGIDRAEGDTVSFSALADTLVVRASGLDSRGEAVSSAGLEWTTADESAVEIVAFADGDSARLVARAPGAAEVVVSHALCRGECADTLPVRVEQAVAALTLAASSEVLGALGDTLRLTAEAMDRNGFPIDGLDDADVAWTSSEPGVLEVIAPGRAIARSRGTARITAAAGDAEATLEVTVESLAARLGILAGDGQTAAVGQTVQHSPAVRVVDANDDPVPGVEVTFTVTAGGGDVTDAVRASDADGIATVGGWTLGSLPGTQSLTATAEGAASVTFTATALTLPAARPDTVGAASAPGEWLHTALNTRLDLAGAEGVLANDELGTEGALVSFGAIQMNDGGGTLLPPAGAVTDHEPGERLDVGVDGSLTLGADGGLVFDPPTDYTGLFRFRYRIANPVGESEATVTLAVGVRPAPDSAAYELLGNVPIEVGAADGLLAGVPGDRLEMVDVEAAGDADVRPDGSFSYTPAPGLRADSMRFTVRNGFGEAEGVARMEARGMIWFVDANGAQGGDGRLGTPFATLEEVEAASESGDVVFIHESVVTLAGPFELKDGQRLIGEGASGSLHELAALDSLPHAAALPTLNPGAEVVLGGAGGIVLGSDNRIHGLAIENASGTAIFGRDYGELFVREVSVASDAGALWLEDGRADVVLGSTTARGGDAGVRIVRTGGELELGGGTISGVDEYSVHVQGGDATIDYGGSILGSSGRATVLVEEGFEGELAFTGETIDADAVRIVENAGAVSFDVDRLEVTAPGGTAFDIADSQGGSVRIVSDTLSIQGVTGGLSATGSGLLEVESEEGGVAATAGTAVRVVGVEIGPAGVTLLSVRAEGAAHGIELRDAGAGPFTVLGDSPGASCVGDVDRCHGGLIENTTDHAIVVEGGENTVSLNSLRIVEAGRSGVWLAGAAGEVSIDDLRIEGTGSLLNHAGISVGLAPRRLSVTSSRITETPFAINLDFHGSGTGGRLEAVIEGNRMESSAHGVRFGISTSDTIIARIEGNHIVAEGNGVYAGIGSGHLTVVGNTVHVTASDRSLVYHAIEGSPCMDTRGNDLNGGTIHLMDGDSGSPLRIAQANEQELIDVNSNVGGLEIDPDPYYVEWNSTCLTPSF